MFLKQVIETIAKTDAKRFRAFGIGFRRIAGQGEPQSDQTFRERAAV